MTGLSRYLARRLAFAVLLVVLVSSGGFLLTRAAPGDFASELYGGGATADSIARDRARLGLDRPVFLHYLDWLGRAARFDLGTSLMFRRPVGELVRERAAHTAVLALVALAVATLVGLPLGVVSGSRAGGVAAAVIRAASTLALSVPSLVLSLLLVYLAARTRWLPIGGMVSTEAAGAGWIAWLGDLARHLPLPAVALALPVAATLERLQSQSMAEAVTRPHVAAARARGVSVRRAIWVHAFVPSLKPVASIYGLVLGSLLSGSFIVEIVTAWPGLGQLMFDALRARDVDLVAGCALAGAVFLAVGSLVSDALLALVEPSLRVPTGASG